MDGEPRTGRQAKSRAWERTAGWVKVAKERLAPVFAGVPLAMMEVEDCLEWCGGGRPLSSRGVFKAVAAGGSLGYALVVYSQQLYMSWRFGAKGSSRWQRAGQALGNTMLGVLVACSAGAACTFPLLEWDDDGSKMICGVVLPSAVTVAHLLTACWGVGPDGWLLADAPAADTGVDLVLGVLPMAVGAAFLGGHEGWARVLGIVGLAGLMAKSARRRGGQASEHARAGKEWRRGVAALAVMSAVGTHVVIGATAVALARDRTLSMSFI